MSTAAKVLSPFFYFCCFRCVIVPLTGVINYVFCIYRFNAAQHPRLWSGSWVAEQTSWYYLLVKKARKGRKFCSVSTDSNWTRQWTLQLAAKDLRSDVWHHWYTSGRVAECLTWDREVAGSNLTHQRQLSVPSFLDRLMSSSLRATGEDLVRLIGVVVYLSTVVMHRRSNCPLSQAMNGRIVRRGTTISRRSATTSQIVKRCCSRVFSCKQRYGKYSDLYLLPFFASTQSVQSDSLSFFRLWCLVIFKLPIEDHVQIRNKLHTLNL